jgi:hypothetical protein
MQDFHGHYQEKVSGTRRSTKKIQYGLVVVDWNWPQSVGKVEEIFQREAMWGQRLVWLAIQTSSLCQY